MHETGGKLTVEFLKLLNEDVREVGIVHVDLEGAVDSLAANRSVHGP